MESSQQTQVAKRFLSLPEVILTTGLSKPTIYRSIGLGKFPAPLQLSCRRIAWSVASVDRWIADLQQTADGKREEQAGA